MSCTKPLKGFVIGKTINNKDSYKITPYAVNHLEFKNSKWQNVYVSHISPSCEKAISTFIAIPCGNCIGCRIEHAKEWSIRCMLEAQEHKDNCFITLTYNDEHIPKSFIDEVNIETGEVNKIRNGDLYSLDYTDFQKFMKRLRKVYPDVRYYVCGEYGDTTHRPHYHAILFGYKPTDLHKETKGSNPLYSSQELQKFWSLNNEPIGNVSVGECTLETCAYVARYVMKKLKGFDSQYYDAYGQTPEFVKMSLKPAIAKSYFDKHKDIDLFEYNKLYLKTKNGSKSFKPFRYFEKKYEEIYPGGLDDYKARKIENAQNFIDIQNMANSKPYIEMLEDRDFILNEKSGQRRKDL